MRAIRKKRGVGIFDKDVILEGNGYTDEDNREF